MIAAGKLRYGLVVCVIAAALTIGGCGRAKGPRAAAPPSAAGEKGFASEKSPPAKPTSVALYLPCVIGGPMRKVAALYEAEHPDVAFAPQTYKPSELPSKSADPAVVITLGDKEMAALIASGVVDKSDARTFATNTYPLAVVAPAKGVKDLKKLDDLAKPSVKHVFVDDPAQSTLGARAADAFGKMGLWEKVRAKALPPAPGVMVLGELLAGKADAAVVFKDCLFGESGEGGSPPKTIRIVGELPSDLYAPIPYQAAVLKTAARPEVARGFVDFLMQEEGRQALGKAGLKPAS